MPTLTKALPLLRVADVGASMAYHAEHLGLNADPLPDQPPLLFAILLGGAAEIMLRRQTNHTLNPARVGWCVSAAV